MGAEREEPLVEKPETAEREKLVKGRSFCQQRKSGSQEGASKSPGRQTLSSGSDGLRGGDGAPAWPKDGREGAHLELPQGEDCRRHRTPGTGGP